LNKFFESIKEKIGIKNKEKETEEEIGNYSMNEGKADKVFGFRREIVKGVCPYRFKRHFFHSKNLINHRIS